MAQPVLSASIVNAAVVAVDRMLMAQDRSLSLTEMAMGVALTSRNFECSFGGCQVEPADSDNAFKPVVVGTGIFRKYGESAPTAINDSSPLETAFASEVFLGARPLNDVYAFGATYAVLYKVSDVPYLSIEALPFRGGATNEGSAMLMCRTMRPDEALALVESAYMTPFTINDPGDEVEYLELQRFVLSVTTYVPDTPGLTEMTAYFSDHRVPRAWGGFADEVSSANLTPAAISNWRAQSEVASQTANALYNFVSAWVSLTAWDPDFVTYWTVNADDMPVRLAQYLLDELNIIL